MNTQCASIDESPGRNVFRPNCIAACLAAIGLASPAAIAAPQGGVVRAGSAQIVEHGKTTRVEQSSQRAVLDWRSFSIAADEGIVFAQPSASSATLNRVTGDQLSLILGSMDANGQVLLINPNGIVFGQGAQINVGGLIASTSSIGNDDFMEGRLLFGQPGKAGAGIRNGGSITAAEGGLVALVAPHVRNDGLIQAHLGQVTMASADTFTIDLYGDGLINLALSDIHAGQLRNADGSRVGSLVTQAGRIDVGGGQAVLVTAETAGQVLDSLINMSGTILADSAIQQGGHILLLGQGGRVEVAGTLSSRGAQGGQIEVLGETVRLTGNATLDASGAGGGGIIHVGGAFQGGGDTYRAQTTGIDAGARLTASAIDSGDGGVVVVWSDGDTHYAGDIEARGGRLSGDGGQVEVSARQTLDFLGLVDASAANGADGSLLLDPAIMNIGVAEAGLISKVLRTGTSTTVAASIDINLLSAIDGRGGASGGGITLTAGSNINLYDYLVTNAGDISLLAGAGIFMADGKGLFSGGGNISLSSASLTTLANLVASGGSIDVDGSSDLQLNGDLVTSGSAGIDLDVAGSISTAAGKGLYAELGPITISAGSLLGIDVIGTGGGDVQLTSGDDMTLAGIVNTQGGLLGIASGGLFDASASSGIFTDGGAIDAQASGDMLLGTIDTRSTASLVSTNGGISLDGAVNADGGITVSAAGDVAVGEAIKTINAGIQVTSSNGSITTPLASTAAGFFVDDGAGAAGSANITLQAKTDVQVHQLVTAGALSLTATDGDIHFYQNPDQRSSSLTAAAGGTLDLDDGATFVSLRSQGAIDLDVGAGLALDSSTVTNRARIESVAGDITIHAAGDITDGLIVGGNIDIVSSGGSIDGVFARGTDTATLDAYTHINTLDLIDAGNSNIGLVQAKTIDLRARTGDLILDVTGQDTLTALADQGDITVLRQFNLGDTAVLTASQGDINIYRTYSTSYTDSSNVDHDSDVTLNALNGAVNIPDLSGGSSLGAVFQNLTVNSADFNIGSKLLILGTFSDSVSGSLTVQSSGIFAYGNGSTTSPAPLNLNAANVTVDGRLEATNAALNITGTTNIAVNGTLRTIISDPDLTDLITPGAPITLTAPTINLGGLILTENQAITLNGDLKIAPSSGSTSYTTYAGTYTDTSPADGAPDGGVYTSTSTLAQQVLIASGPAPALVFSSPTTLPAGAAITINGDISLDSGYTGHAILQIASGQAATSFNGSLAGVSGAASDTRSLQLGVAAGSVTLAGGETLQPNSAFFYHLGGVLPPGCSGICVLASPGFYNIANSSNTLYGQTVTQLGYATLVVPWPDQDTPGIGNGIPRPAGPKAVLLSFSPLSISKQDPATITPGAFSSLAAVPQALTEIFVDAPSLSVDLAAGGGLAGAENTAITAASETSDVVIASDSEQTESQAGASNETVVVFEGGRGIAQSLDGATGGRLSGADDSEDCAIQPGSSRRGKAGCS